MFTFSSVLVPPQWQFCGALRNRKKNLLLYLGLSPPCYLKRVVE